VVTDKVTFHGASGVSTPYSPESDQRNSQSVLDCGDEVCVIAAFLFGDSPCLSTLFSTFSWFAVFLGVDSAWNRLCPACPAQNR
jgi:hypothetical protein